LLPDFMGKPFALERVLSERPDIAAHNIETVERLTPSVRSHAKYRYSLDVLARIAGSGAVCKSGMMLGLGERQEEVLQTLRELREAGVCVVTLGQYLQPTHGHYPVERYVPPEEFSALRHEALRMGFRYVEAGPLVRSSFHASRALAACGVSSRDEIK
ncbi:MAG: lipoyl synthase, partial [Bacteroidia bacterium]|nr:lipoyl synthase [Bacteroidia bacterium]